jgi:hypothetical protein
MMALPLIEYTASSDPIPEASVIEIEELVLQIAD